MGEGGWWLLVDRGHGLKSRFSTRRNIPRPVESLLFFIEFHQKRTLKSRNKFNFLAAENSGNQPYCSLCVPT